VVRFAGIRSGDSDLGSPNQIRCPKRKEICHG